MNRVRTQKLNAFQRFNRRVVLSPLLRTRLIWIGRVWLVNLFHTISMIIESIFKAIAKFLFIVLAAIFFL